MNEAGRQKLSDLLLGGIALAIGAGVLWNGAGSLFSGREHSDGYFYPALVALGLVAIGAILLLRAYFAPPPPARWSLKGVAAVALVALAVPLGVQFSTELLLRFGPSEYAAFLLLLLAAAILVARRSRVRAAAMALLGLLLTAVGMDVITGQIRLTLGFERLLDGIDFALVQYALIVVGDGLLALASPALWFASFKWLEGNWQDRPPTGGIAILIRVLAAATIAALCYYAWALNHDVLDIGLLLAFGALGVASKLLGWNRPVLIVAFGFSTMLEETIRQTMLMSRGDLMPLFGRPIGGTLLIAALALAVLSIVLSLRRTFGRAVG